jgi:phosphate transport system substrate-binding protein
MIQTPVTKYTILKVALLAWMLGAASIGRAGQITVKGSDTLVILAQKWAEVYMQSHPEVKIQVTGGGSGNGFAALQTKGTDIADASRQITPAEKEGCIKSFGKVPREYRVAVDGLSVYVNKANPVKELSLDQLAGVFTGQITNWSEVGGDPAPITIYSRENSSGTYEFFKTHVLNGKDFAATAQNQQGTGALLQAVMSDVNGIGYGGAAYGAGARALGIKKDAVSPAIAPTEETVINQTYPLWRYLYNYINPTLDQGEIHAYLDWIRSDAGQQIVKEVSYYPLPADQRSK